MCGKTGCASDSRILFGWHKVLKIGIYKTTVDLAIQGYEAQVKYLIIFQFKQLMLKFDPDDPDDDEPNGAPPKITVKLGGDDVRPSEPSDSGGDRGVPDRSRQNTQHEEQKVKEAIHYSAYGNHHPKSCSGSVCLVGPLCLCF